MSALRTRYFLAGILFLAFFCLPAHRASANTCTAATGSWSDTSKWSGCGGTTPQSGDDVVIPAGVTMTLDITASAVSVNTVTLSAGTTAAVLTQSASTTLNVTSTAATAFTINQPTAAATSSWNINTATATISGGLTFVTASNTASLVAQVAVTTGSLTVSGAVTFGASTLAADQVLSFTSGTVTINGNTTEGCGSIKNLTTAGNLRFGGTFTFGSASCTPSFTALSGGSVKFASDLTAVKSLTISLGSVTEFTGSGTVTPTATITFGNLQIDSGVTVTLAGSVTIHGSLTNMSSDVITGTLTGLSPGTSTVTFDTSGTIGGSAGTAFYNLVISRGGVVTLSKNAQVLNNFQINGGSAANTATFTQSGASLTVGGTVLLLEQNADGQATNWLVNNGTATVTGLTTIGGSTASATRISKIIVTTGSVTLAGGVTFGTNTFPAAQAFDLSGGAGTLNIAGTITNPNRATMIPGTTSTVNFYGTSAQTIPMGTSGGTSWGACTTQCYANLTISNTNASGATLGNTAASGNISGNLTVDTNAIFKNGGFVIAGASGKTFAQNAGSTFTMTGSSVFPSVFTPSLDASSTTVYNQTTLSTIAAATYGNLTLNASGQTAQLAGDTAVAGNLSLLAGTLDLGTANFSVTGTTTLNGGGLMDSSGTGTDTFTGSVTITSGTWNFLGGSPAVALGGSLNVADTFVSGAGLYTMSGTGTSISGSPVFENLTVSGTVTFASPVTISSTLVVSGTLDTAGNDFSAGMFSISGNFIPRSSLISITEAGTIFDCVSCTYTTGTEIIKIVDTSVDAKIFAGGGQTYHELWYAPGAGTAPIIIEGDNAFGELKDDGSVAHTIYFTAGSTQNIGTFSVNGTPGALISLDSTTTDTYTLAKTGGGTVSVDYLDIQHSVATPADTWTAGENSLDHQSVATAGSGWTIQHAVVVDTTTTTTDTTESAPTPVIRRSGAGLLAFLALRPSTQIATPSAPAPVQPAVPVSESTPAAQPVISGIPSGFQFKQSVKFSNTNADIKMLQIFLNENGFPVANTGPGSKGNESGYFGSKTKNALIRFQNAFGDRILRPQGLAKGTGTFGSYTRAVINAMLAGQK